MNCQWHHPSQLTEGGVWGALWPLLCPLCVPLAPICFVSRVDFGRKSSPRSQVGFFPGSLTREGWWVEWQLDGGGRGCS